MDSRLILASRCFQQKYLIKNYEALKHSIFVILEEISQLTGFYG